MEPQLSVFNLRPDAPLCLRHAKKSRLAVFFERLNRFVERLRGVEMKNGFPLRLSAFGNPFFHREKSMRHGSRAIVESFWPEGEFA